MNMIFGHGIDIIEISRIKKAIEKSERFQTKIFSQNEIAYCESKANKYQSYAARFATKEAFFKAIGTGWANGIKWTDIEVLNNESGKPILCLHNKALIFINENNINNLHVSISHLKDIAIASVILEK